MSGHDEVRPGIFGDSVKVGGDMLLWKDSVKRRELKWKHGATELSEKQRSETKGGDQRTESAVFSPCAGFPREKKKGAGGALDRKSSCLGG